MEEKDVTGLIYYYNTLNLSIKDLALVDTLIGKGGKGRHYSCPIRDQQASVKFFILSLLYHNELEKKEKLSLWIRFSDVHF
jgi:hypothetical protein